MGWSPQSLPLWCGFFRTSLEQEAQLSSGGPSPVAEKTEPGHERGCLFESELDRGGQKLGNPLGR